MKITSTKTTEIYIELDETEAQVLKDLLQNAPVKLEHEAAPVTRIRGDLFNLLKKHLE